MSTTPATKPQPVLIVMSVMSSLTMAVGGLASISEVPRLVVALSALVVGSVNVGMAYYLRGQVVPLADTAAYLNEARTLIAGPAAREVTGAPVEVVPTPATPTGEPQAEYVARHLEG